MRVTVEYLTGSDGTQMPTEHYEHVAGIGLAGSLVQLQSASGKPIALINAMVVRRIHAPDNDTNLELPS